MFKGEPPTYTDENNIHYLSNLDIAGRSANFLYLIAILMAGLLSTGFRYAYEGQTDRVALGFQIFCCALVLTFWLMRKLLGPRPHNILSPDTIFVGFFCAFHFSYIALYAINMVPWSPEVFWVPEKVLPALNFCVWCLIVFLIGYEIAGNRYSQYAQNPVIEEPPKHLLFISKLLVFIGAGMFFAAILTLGRGAITDYSEMIGVGGASPLGRLFWFGQYLAISGIAMYCAASGLMYTKHMAGVFMVLAWFYILAILVLGDRGGFVQLFIIPLLAFHYFQKKIKLQWLLAMLWLIFTCMAIVGVARRAAFGNVFQMYREYKSSEQSEAYSPVVHSLAEFGASVKTVVIAMDLVPEWHGYWMGRSYVEGLSILLPNIIPGRARQQTRGVGVWLTETAFGSLHGTHGRGGSIAMEAYVNFGFFGGVLSFGLLGYLLRCVYERFLVHPSFLRIAILFGIMAGYALWMRNTFNTFVRPAFWTFFIAYAFFMITRPKNAPVEDHPIAHLDEAYE